MNTEHPRYFRLTKSENEIMELMWKEGHPLSRSEIIDLTPERTWKPSSIHILLNSMLEKNAIEVAGFVQSTGILFFQDGGRGLRIYDYGGIFSGNEDAQGRWNHL